MVTVLAFINKEPLIPVEEVTPVAMPRISAELLPVGMLTVLLSIRKPD